MPTRRCVSQFPWCVHGTYLHQLDYEWRDLESLTIPDSMKFMSISEAFFRELYNFDNEFDVHCFWGLSHFALTILSLPTSNADADHTSQS